MEAEQRNNVRFLAQDDVVVALRNTYTKIGKVKDISKGGLSFEHTMQKTQPWALAKRNPSLDQWILDAQGILQGSV